MCLAEAGVEVDGKYRNGLRKGGGGMEEEAETGGGKEGRGVQINK